MASSSSGESNVKRSVEGGITEEGNVEEGRAERLGEAESVEVENLEGTVSEGVEKNEEENEEETRRKEKNEEGNDVIQGKVKEADEDRGKGQGSQTRSEDKGKKSVKLKKVVKNEIEEEKGGAIEEEEDSAEAPLLKRKGVRKETNDVESTSEPESKAKDKKEGSFVHRGKVQEEEQEASSGSSWGWGGWGAALSVVSAIQEASGELSHAAVEAAKGVLQSLDEEKAEEEEGEEEEVEEKVEGAGEELRKDMADGESLKDGLGAAPISRIEGAEVVGKAGSAEPDERRDRAAAGGAEKEEESATVGVHQEELVDGQGGKGEEKATGSSWQKGADAENGGDEEVLAEASGDKDFEALNESMESMASGALQALGSAWMGGLSFVQQLEQSAEVLAASIQDGRLHEKASELAPTILEGGKGFAEQGMKMLETISKDTIDILVAETGIELEKDEEYLTEKEEEEEEGVEDEEEATFDRCFYIYGGPEHLEELEALADHYTVLCIRARGKMTPVQRARFDESLHELQKTMALDVAEEEGKEGAGNKGGEKGGEDSAIVLGDEEGEEEVEMLRDSSLEKAAEMSAGFESKVKGVSGEEVLHRTADRLREIKAEGIHRVSELSATCISRLHQLALSALSSSSSASSTSERGEEMGGEGEEGGKREEGGREGAEVEAKVQAEGGSKSEATWPKDCGAKARLVKARAKTMAAEIDAVLACFLKAISEVMGMLRAALSESKQKAEGEGGEEEGGKEKDEKKTTEWVEGIAKSLAEELKGDGEAALAKFHEGIQHLVYVLLSSTLHS